ncbi:hypothetical protein LCGC14_1159730 [marine sediment metagenome]|uniref:Uncharacterized protein n=1 Tax=marine sediment metagenome TaxID=412755 RepID=A0A0F9PBE7_9ZZZZ|nr:hypothetical protein [Phycisphaerae bacterium]
MAEIRSASEIAAKWATVTPQRTADYESGVRQPRKDWARATAAAADAWKTGVTEAIAGGRFVKGVNRAGTAVWQAGAIEKGIPRWGQGVQVAQSKYETAFAPYRDAIEGVTLPARFARRDPRNLDRVKAIVDAMNKTKARLAGA